MKKIMIVEDDETIGYELAKLLENNHFQPILLQDYQNALAEILDSACDLILLDMNIPFTSGEVLLQELRKQSNIPVIMVTSRNSEIDEALSMSYGADDYITKPYNPHILILRIKAVLKRTGVISPILSYKDAIVHMQKGMIKKDQIEITLTKNEMIIFSCLLQHQDRIVTRDELMVALWSHEEFMNDNTLTVNISRLRTKLRNIGYEDAIDTRKGMGYILR